VERTDSVPIVYVAPHQCTNVVQVSVPIMMHQCGAVCCGATWQIGGVVFKLCGREWLGGDVV